MQKVHLAKKKMGINPKVHLAKKMVNNPNMNKF